MNEFLTILKALAAIADEPGTILEEGWGYTRLNLAGDPGFLANYNTLKQELQVLGLSDNLTIWHGDSLISDPDDDELRGYLNQKVKGVQLRLNKEDILKRPAGDFHVNLFLKEINCISWLEGLDPLNALSPLNSYTHFKILVNDLKEPFGGPFIQFLSGTVQQDWEPGKAAWALPEWNLVRENVHLVGDDLLLNYRCFWLTEGNDSSLRTAFLKIAVSPFVVAVGDEYLGENKIVLDGVRRISLDIGPTVKKVGWDYYSFLVKLISWLYAERVHVRKKLFAERLSLDLDQDKTLADALLTFGEKALSQAEARYNFVIIDRKDAYVKELKELLKDIRTQSDLLAGKIRTLLSNFLRDMLAAIVLIGFTIFTKFGDISTLERNKLMLQFVFNTLAIYYLAAVALQFIIDLTDVSISKKELLYWNKASKELLPEKEFRQHIDASLKFRRYSQFLYLLVGVGYLGIAYICHIYPDLFEAYFKK